MSYNLSSQLIRPNLHLKSSMYVCMDSPVDTTGEKADKSFAEVGPHVGMKTNS